MSDYIKREEAIQIAWCYVDDRDAIDELNGLPKADVVDVVRCKDCKYATYDKSIDRYNCRNWGLYGDENTEADDFCSYGEKRDD